MLLQARKFLNAIAFCFVILVAVLTLYHNLKFLSGRSDLGFLMTKGLHVRTSKIYLWAFYMHIYSGSVVLIAGLLQLWRSKSNLWLHRLLGRFYVIIILLATAPSGMIMSCFANGGIIPSASFLLLAVSWWWFTWIAWRSAIKHNLVEHEKYIIRSYALTLAAVTLRLYIFLIAWIFELKGEEVYIWVSVLCWVPNLMIVELMFFYRGSTGIIVKLLAFRAKNAAPTQNAQMK